VARGIVPDAEIIDGFLVFAGAVLLLTPGFVSDVLGLCLLFPPSRLLLRGSVRHRLGLRAHRMLR
jgi:UPF0716 protein FxsA